MFSHVVVGSNNLEAAMKFYDATFAALGEKPGAHMGDRLIYQFRGGASFIVTRPINGAPATVANGATIGFRADTPEDVQAWHEAGCEGGGATCEDPPGVRDVGAVKVYLAYLRDPDGNKLCAMRMVG